MHMNPGKFSVIVKIALTKYSLVAMKEFIFICRPFQRRNILKCRIWNGISRILTKESFLRCRLFLFKVKLYLFVCLPWDSFWGERNDNCNSHYLSSMLIETWLRSEYSVASGLPTGNSGRETYQCMVWHSLQITPTLCDSWPEQPL